MGGSELTVIAILTGFAAIVVAVGGILLAIRAVRSKERKSAGQEIEQLVALLDTERNARLEAEVRAHDYAVQLAQHGIHVDPWPVHDAPVVETPAPDLSQFRRPRDEPN